MLFKIGFEDHGQDFLQWTIDTEKERVVDCQPFQQDIWVGKKCTQKAFEVGGFVIVGTPYTKDGVMTIKHPISSIDAIVQ